MAANKDITIQLKRYSQKKLKICIMCAAIICVYFLYFFFHSYVYFLLQCTSDITIVTLKSSVDPLQSSASTIYTKSPPRLRTIIWKLRFPRFPKRKESVCNQQNDKYVTNILLQIN